MKIISFLGLNSYRETNYVHPDGSRSVKTPFFQEALVNFYQPDTLYVLLTKSVETKPPRDASETNWNALKKRLNGKVKLEPVKDIPEQNRPEDVWSIFERVNDCLEEGDRVIFDITHSFRSVPIVALIAVSYLRVARQIQIEGLLYGAFEAKNPETNEAPTFDLLPIVSLLDWTTATDQFLKTGTGQELASLLQGSDAPTQNLASNIEGISQGLELLRPLDVMRESALLPDRIETARSSSSTFPPPFETLLKRVSQDYGRFGLQSPDNDAIDAKSSLLKQLNMIEWYAEKRQIVQALSLAREWLPSLLCYHFNLDPFNFDDRNEMELLLNGGKYKDREGNTLRESPYLEQWHQRPKKQRKRVNKIWSGDFKLPNLRNDVLHAGFRKNSKTATEIIRQTEQIVEKLKAIALEWNLID